MNFEEHLKRMSRLALAAAHRPAKNLRRAKTGNPQKGIGVSDGI
jgi:hypothetical protein